MDEDIRKRFGRRVRALRKKHGWTQVVLAERLGLDRTYLADIELGRMNVSLINIEIIAQGFGLSLSKLFSKV